MPGGHDAVVTQFSLFGAEAAAPALGDLEGVLLAGGQWVRSDGRARLSIVVADAWRADALATAFAERGVAADAEDTVRALEGRVAVRTALSAELTASAARWIRGARIGAPPGFVLSAGGLRLWTIAAGRRDDAGYLLVTGDGPDGELHRCAGGQLARFGLAAVALSQRPGPGWRISSARRLRRFAELVGAAPAGAGSDWP